MDLFELQNAAESIGGPGATVVLDEKCIGHVEFGGCASGKWLAHCFVEYNRAAVKKADGSLVYFTILPHRETKATVDVAPQVASAARYEMPPNALQWLRKDQLKGNPVDAGFTHYAHITRSTVAEIKAAVEAIPARAVQEVDELMAELLPLTDSPEDQQAEEQILADWLEHHQDITRQQVRDVLLKLRASIQPPDEE